MKVGDFTQGIIAKLEQAASLGLLSGADEDKTDEKSDTSGMREASAFYSQIVAIKSATRQITFYGQIMGTKELSLVLNLFNKKAFELEVQLSDSDINQLRSEMKESLYWFCLVVKAARVRCSPWQNMKKDDLDTKHVVVLDPRDPKLRQWLHQQLQTQLEKHRHN